MDSEVCRARILSEEYFDFIVPLGGRRTDAFFLDTKPCVQETKARYEIWYIDKAQASPMNLERFSYNAIPQCFTLLDVEALNQAGISQVQNYPTLQLMGENIMIGFIDTGIDYQNPIFRNLDGTTRIAGIWDQTIQNGTLPQGLGYGSAYTEDMINEALASEAPLELVPTVDENGHGTFVASLAAGSADIQNNFLGAAPESTIAVVKLKDAKRYLRNYYVIPEEAPCYQENDIMLGIRYLLDLADAREMPIVICIALGSSFGGHNGTTPLSIMMEHYAFYPNRIMVSGVGNEANQGHHYSGKIDGMDNREEVEIRVGENVEGFTMELWTDIPNLMTISMVSPSGEVIPRISIRQGSSEVFRFLFEGTEVYVDYRILVERNSSQLIYFRFSAPTAGIWKINVEPLRLATGVFHMWLPVKEFLSGEVFFLRPDPDMTLTSPAVTADIISVAYYNGSENSIDINSGRGYTRDGRIKPDFAAPGVGVTGALPGGRFAKRTGSSISTAITVGACALLMEWILYQMGYPGVDSLQIKNIFILGARQRPNAEYPNRVWGYGTLDLYNTLESIREI